MTLSSRPRCLWLFAPGLCLIGLALAACTPEDTSRTSAHSPATAAEQSTLNPPTEYRVLFQTPTFDADFRQMPPEVKPAPPKINSAMMKMAQAEMPKVKTPQLRALFMDGNMLIMGKLKPIVTFTTNKGTFKVQVDPADIPVTAGNFIDLVVGKTYNGTKFNRYEKGFILQGGDPTNTGTGGPGYTIFDELGPLKHDAGAVGMAKSNPDMAGSQFYITLGPAHQLDDRFTVFGKVVEGMNVVQSLRQNDKIISATVAGLPKGFGHMGRSPGNQGASGGMSSIEMNQLGRMMSAH